MSNGGGFGSNISAIFHNESGYWVWTGRLSEGKQDAGLVTFGGEKRGKRKDKRKGEGLGSSKRGLMISSLARLCLFIRPRRRN